MQFILIIIAIVIIIATVGALKDTGADDGIIVTVITFAVKAFSAVILGGGAAVVAGFTGVLLPLALPIGIIVAIASYIYMMSR